VLPEEAELGIGCGHEASVRGRDSRAQGV
jgi:hypothetical protein